jgi:ankyrin repeat protein
MKILLREGADIHAAGDCGLTPLHYAAMKGHIEAAMLLLDHGARKDIRDMDGALPIDWARNLKHPAVVQLLEGVAQPGRAGTLTE